MNEEFETLSGISEELRSESGERKYSIQTEEAQSANKELKKKNKSYEKFLLDISADDRAFLEDYMETLEHAHYQEGQRAYYQGMVDAIQILASLGIVQPREKVKELLKRIQG